MALSHLTHEGSQSKRIDVIYDVYCRNSIQQAERVNRGADSNALQYKNLAGGHHVLQWINFLSSSSKQTSLIRFLSEEWKLPKYRQKLSYSVLYVTCEEG